MLTLKVKPQINVTLGLTCIIRISYRCFQWSELAVEAIPEPDTVDIPPFQYVLKPVVHDRDVTQEGQIVFLAYPLPNPQLCRQK